MSELTTVVTIYDLADADKLAHYNEDYNALHDEFQNTEFLDRLHDVITRVDTGLLLVYSVPKYGVNIPIIKYRPA